MKAESETNGASSEGHIIHTVLFDLDGTLVFHEPDSFDVLSQFCADIGQPLSAEVEHRGRRTRHEYFVDPVIREKLTHFSPGEFWQHFNRHLLSAIGIEGDLDQLADEVTGRFAGLELAYECPPAGCETLAALAARLMGRAIIAQRRWLGATRPSPPPNCSMKPTPRAALRAPHCAAFVPAPRRSWGGAAYLAARYVAKLTVL